MHKILDTIVQGVNMTSDFLYLASNKSKLLLMPNPSLLDVYDVRWWWDLVHFSSIHLVLVHYLDS